MDLRKTLEHWSKDWGVRLAGFAAAVLGGLTSVPGALEALVALLPSGPARLLAALTVAIVFFGVPTVTQILQDVLREREADGE